VKATHVITIDARVGDDLIYGQGGAEGSADFQFGDGGDDQLFGGSGEDNQVGLRRKSCCSVDDCVVCRVLCVV
jgi:hypothetical protein